MANSVADDRPCFVKSTLAVSLLAMAASALTATRADAAIVFTFTQSGGNVRLDYSGSLDMSGIPLISGRTTNYTINNAIPEHSVRYVFPVIGDDFTSLINVNSETVRVYFSPFASGPGMDLTAVASTPEADSSGGTRIIPPSVSNAPNATLRLATAGFTSNDPNLWTGSGFMQWNNKTLAQLNIDGSPKTWVVNGSLDTITMTSIVPKPSSLALAGLGMVALARRLRRLSPLTK